MGFATEPVRGKGSSFPLDYGQTGVSFYNNNESESESEALSGVQLFATPWTVAYQAPLSMEFSRQEYWSGLSFPSPGDLPDPGIEPGSPALQADSSLSEPPGKPHKSIYYRTAVI